MERNGAKPMPDKGWTPFPGNVTYTETDVINIHIAGTGDKEYDRLEITGTLTPGGATLNVFPCYTLTPGDRFEIFEAQSISGKFSNQPLIDAGNNFFILSYEDDLVVLTAVAKIFGLTIKHSDTELLDTPDEGRITQWHTYNLNLIADPVAGGTVSATKADFSVCNVVEISVIPFPISSPAYLFSHWSQQGGAVIENTTSKTTTATMPAHDVKLIANFDELEPVPLTITGTFTAENKIYDGTVTATIVTNDLQLVGFSDLRGNDVTLTDIVLTFDNADIGTDKTVSIASATLSGEHAGNYTLNLTGAPTTTANITAKELKIGGTFTANNKDYDAEVDAEFDQNNLALVGIVESEDVNLTVVVLEFADKNVGAHSVTITAANLTGDAIGNYTLTLSGAPTTSASITEKVLTISGTFTANDKPFDGNVNASGNVAGLSLIGVVSGDAVSLTDVQIEFNDAEVGDNKPVNITAADLTDTNAGNYTLSLDGAPTTTASITCPLDVTFTYRGEQVTYGLIERGGLCWMDRNLGADPMPFIPANASGNTDTKLYGHLFQWGRLDDGHQVRTSSPISGPVNQDVPGHGNFITVGESSPWDWRSPQNNALWQGKDGTNNPCPPGWRVPTEAELNAELNSWEPKNRDGAYASTLKWPVGGLRYHHGHILDAGSTGSVWSSSVSGVEARDLGFGSDYAGIYSDRRAIGMSVRCVMD